MKTNNNGEPNIPRGTRFLFGIFMILFYIAVGICFILPVFTIFDRGLSAVVGGILCAYGVWRGIRLFRGSR